MALKQFGNKIISISMKEKSPYDLSSHPRKYCRICGKRKRTRSTNPYKPIGCFNYCSCK